MAETVWPEGSYPPEAVEACPEGGDHDFHATILSEATDDEDGIRLFVCSKCGLSFEAAIEHTGHDWGPWIVDVEPTCVSEGKEHRECRRHEAEGIIHYEYQTLPALSSTGEHTWVQTGGQDPTATQDGWVIYTCSVCGATKTETIPAKGAVAETEAATPVVTAPSSPTEGQQESDEEPVVESAQTFWSFEPNRVDRTLLALDALTVVIDVALLIPLLPALLWLHRKKKEAYEEGLSFLEENRDPGKASDSSSPDRKPDERQ